MEQTLSTEQVNCEVLQDSDKDEESTMKFCTTLMIEENSVTCECDRIGLYVAVVVRCY